MPPAQGKQLRRPAQMTLGQMQQQQVGLVWLVMGSSQMRTWLTGGGDVDAAGYGTPTHPGGDVGGTPTRPASEDYMDDSLAVPGGGADEAAAARSVSLSAGGAGVGGSNAIPSCWRCSAASSCLVRTALHLLLWKQLVPMSNPLLLAAAAWCCRPGSFAGVAPGAMLQAIGSVTSKTSAAAGSALTGIDWAAIQNEALKAVLPGPQTTGRPNQHPGEQDIAAAVPAGGDDAPYNPG